MSFALKAFERGLFYYKFGRQHLDNDLAVEFCVERPVNGALPAHTELFQYPVMI